MGGLCGNAGVSDTRCMKSDDIYRLRYTRRDNDAFPYRLAIVSDATGNVAGAKFRNRPKVEATRAWLAAKGFEAYGDMLRLSDGSYVSMVRRTA